MTGRKTKSEAKAACCDYCDAELGCTTDSIRLREYWQSSQTGFVACNLCLPTIADYFPQLSGEQRLLALRMHWARGISLPTIADAINAARGIVVHQQLSKLLEEKEMVEQLHREGELVASVWAAQALWNSTNHLRDALGSRPDRELGQKMRAGRKPGTKGPVRKKIESYLKKRPTAKNEEIWEAVAKSPPKGWVFSDNRLGRYIEGPSASDNMKFSRFRNICSEERKLLR